jgi:penicillin amidase
MDEAVKQMKDLAKKVLVPTSGSLTAKGLKDEVRILRDKWGVPHIFASSPEDLFLALGYTHAQERLWQLEFNRRLACGTLSEIVGETTVEIDVFMRTAGLRRSAETAADLMEKDGDSPTQRMIMAYVRGINGFIGRSLDNPPFEFAVLGWRPSTWALSDSVACGLLLAWQLSLNWCAEILRAELVERLGEKRARELLPSYPTDASLVVPSQCRFGDMATYVLTLQKKAPGSIGFDAGSSGSNNWVIDGTMSATGMPLLANDPHLPMSTPAIFYEAHLVAPGFNVTGASYPGIPGVVIGHNERIAWGVTTLFADVQDTYLEELNPDNPHQYLYQGKWQDAEVRVEQFQVRGKEQPVTKEVLITRHGPIMDSVMLAGAKTQVRKGLPQAIALRWTGHDPENVRVILGSFLELDQAANWEGFRNALQSFSCPLMNFVYADVEGNIGYQANGLIPIRAKGQGLVPVPGWTGEYEWVGFIPFDEMPSAFNPPTHFIATANNRIVDEDYPHFISHDWAPPHRARRIVQMLTAKDQFTIQDFMAMQGDVYSLWAEELMPYLTRLAAQNQLQSQALGYLRSWDLRMNKDSVATTIFQVWYQKFVQNAIGDKLGKDLYEQYLTRPLGLNFHHFIAIPALLEYHDSYWFSSSSGSNLESRDRLCLLSLQQAIDELSAVVGPDMSAWRWGKVHIATFRHPLSVIPPLDQVLNAGTAELGGDRTTVNLASFDYNAWPREVVGIPSYRQIIDMSDFSRSLSMHAPGQSGQPASEHYGDFVTPWAEVRYHPMLFDKATIEREAEEVLILLPHQTS